MNDLNEKYCCSRKRELSFIKGFFFGGIILPIFLIGFYIVNSLLFNIFDCFLFQITLISLFLFVPLGIFVIAIMNIVDYLKFKKEKNEVCKNGK